MAGTTRKRESIMIRQKPANIEQGLINTIEIKAPTEMATGVMLATAVAALQALNPHLRIRDARKNHDSRKNKNKPRRDEVIISRPVQAPPSGIEKLNRANGAPVDGKAITDPTFKSGAMINATMQTTTPLGGLDDVKMVQESMIKTLAHVNKGHNIDFLA
jgi:hypothetical protein